MKLLCIIPSYWPAFQYGGPIYSVHGLNKAMVEKGVDVSVWTTNLGLKDRDDIPLGREVIIDGVRVHYFPIIDSFHYALSPALMWYMDKRIKDFDVVHIQGIYQFHSFVGGYFARKYGIPYVLSPRGMFLPEFIKMKGRLKKKIYINLVEKRNLKKADLVHCTTEDEQKGLGDLGISPKRTIVIPNGIPTEEIRGEFKEGTFKEEYNLSGKITILFLSRLIWSKGLNILIPAFSKVVSQYRNTHLVLAGPDSEGYRCKVEKWIRDDGIEDFVTFAGFLKDKEKLAALLGSDIFVQPSYSESFGMAAVEAMFAGLPVVLSKKVGIWDVIEKDKCGVIVELTPESIAEGILHLLKNPEERLKMGKRGKETAKREFSIDNVAERMINAYNDIVQI